MCHPMAIAHSGTFNYKADFTEESFGESEIRLRGIDPERDSDRLVGHDPTIRFWGDRLIIFTSEERGASFRHASYMAGDAVGLTARPGDRLYLRRTATGDIGLSVLRRQSLVLAIGAVTAVPLGEGLRVERGSNGGWPDRNRIELKTWLEISLGGERVSLRGREFAEPGGFHVYVERCWAFGMPGVGECVSVCASGDPAVRVAAIRSAVLLGNGDQRLIKWDNTELVTHPRRA